MKGVLIVKPLAKEEIKNGIVIPGFIEQNLEKQSMVLRRGEIVKINATLEYVADDGSPALAREGDTVYFVDGTYEKGRERINHDEFKIDGEVFVHVKDFEVRLVVPA